MNPETEFICAIDPVCDPEKLNFSMLQFYHLLNGYQNDLIQGIMKNWKLPSVKSSTIK